MLLSAEINLFPDWTFFIQLGIFLTVLVCLNHLVFKPVLKILKLRRAKTEGDRKRIEEVMQRTEILIKDYTSKMEEAKKEGFQVKETIRKEGQEQGNRMIQEARSASQAQIEKIKKEIEGASLKAARQLELQTDVLSRQIAEKVLGRPV